MSNKEQLENWVLKHKSILCQYNMRFPVVLLILAYMSWQCSSQDPWEFYMSTRTLLYGGH